VVKKGKNINHPESWRHITYNESPLSVSIKNPGRKILRHLSSS
jgi:hypothetical protein